jgi:hypothetical protein
MPVPVLGAPRSVFAGQHVGVCARTCVYASCPCSAVPVSIASASALYSQCLYICHCCAACASVGACAGLRYANACCLNAGEVVLPVGGFVLIAVSVSVSQYCAGAGCLYRYQTSLPLFV